VFIGHFALGFGAKRLVPKASLGTLFLACQLADLLWPTLVLAGAESFQVEPGMTAVTPLDFTHYPYSHSLLGLAVYGLVLGLSYGVVRRDAKGVLVLGALVVSHWLLEPVRSTAAERRGRRLVRAGHLAARALGLLGRSSSRGAGGGCGALTRRVAERHGSARLVW